MIPAQAALQHQHFPRPPRPRLELAAPLGASGMEEASMDQSDSAGAKRPASALGPLLGTARSAPSPGGLNLGKPSGLAAPQTGLAAPQTGLANPQAGTALGAPLGGTPVLGAPGVTPQQLQALTQRIDQLELNNRMVGADEHAAPLGVATAKLLNHVERRLASVEHDLGITYQFQLPHQLPEQLKEGNRMYNLACEQHRGKKDLQGKPIMAPPCWGYVQFQLTEAMIADADVQPATREKVDALRREILDTPEGAIPPENLKNFMSVCSTATCHVAKKVAFVELRTHQRAPTAPDNSSFLLREMFHEYLINKGGVAQVLERTPAPISRDLRTTLGEMGYGPKGKGRGKGTR